jgi:hypothetical protein
MNIYEVLKEHADILIELEEAGGELSPDLENRLSAISTDRDTCITSIVGAIKNYDANLDAIDSEIKRLRGLKAQAERSKERIKLFLSTLIPTGEKWAHGTHKISWRHSVRVEIAEGVIVPEQYTRKKYTEENDKVLIKTDLECGAKIPGCSLVEEHHIQIK